MDNWHSDTVKVKQQYKPLCPYPLKEKAFALVSQASPEFQKADSRVNNWKIEDVEAKNSSWAGETGNNLDYDSATQQKRWNPSSLKDIDKGLTHIPQLFLQEADCPPDENCWPQAHGP